MSPSLADWLRPFGYTVGNGYPERVRDRDIYPLSRGDAPVRYIAEVVAADAQATGLARRQVEHAERHPDLFLGFEDILEWRGQLVLIRAAVGARPATLAPVDPDCAVAAFAALARLVARAHALGFSLGVRADDFVFLQDGSARVDDHGAARQEGDREPPNLAPVLPCAYSAPDEVLRNPERVDPSADLFVVGACIYFLTAGRRLFDFGNDVSEQHVRRARLSGAARLEALSRFVATGDLPLPLKVGLSMALAPLDERTHGAADLVEILEGRSLPPASSASRARYAAVIGERLPWPLSVLPDSDRETRALKTGDTVLGVRLGPALGSGRQAMVYAGEDLVLGRDVVVRVDAPDPSPDAAVSVERLTELHGESLALAARLPPLSAFPRVYAAGARPVLHAVIERMTGEPLARRVLTAQPFPLMEGLRLFRDAFAAMSAVHAAGVAQLDINLQNVWFDERRGLVFPDIGSLVRADAPASVPVVISRYYAAPEAGVAGTDRAKGDVWALTLLLVESLSADCTRIFPTGDDEEHARQAAKAAGPVQFEPGTPDAFARMVAAGTDPDPAARATAEEMVRMFDTILREGPLTESPRSQRSTVLLPLEQASEGRAEPTAPASPAPPPPVASRVVGPVVATRTALPDGAPRKAPKAPSPRVRRMRALFGAGGVFVTLGIVAAGTGALWLLWRLLEVA